MELGAADRRGDAAPAEDVCRDCITAIANYIARLKSRDGDAIGSVLAQRDGRAETSRDSQNSLAERVGAQSSGHGTLALGWILPDWTVARNLAAHERITMNYAGAGPHEHGHATKHAGRGTVCFRCHRIEQAA